MPLLLLPPLHPPLPKRCPLEGARGGGPPQDQAPMLRLWDRALHHVGLKTTHKLRKKVTAEKAGKWSGAGMVNNASVIQNIE